MTEAERRVAEAKANAASKPRDRKPQPNKDLESSLALAADAQYQNGVDLVKRIGEQSFIRGVSDTVDKLISSSSMSEDQLTAIAEKFQNAASKSSSATLFLPVAAWLDTDDKDGEDND
jgi:hypothetical protein